MYYPSVRLRKVLSCPVLQPLRCFHYTAENDPLPIPGESMTEELGHRKECWTI